ncbi:MAG: class II fumarate hydratase [Desulfobacterales bacterium]|nr:class II fumarate hydratase [Desulfobacterales bacterium]
MKDVREEKDTMGSVRVPLNAHYGAQTQRAVENFAISGLVFPDVFITSLALVKRCAAQVNGELGLLDGALADAIIRAADEVMAGRLANQFVVDVFQTGSGTSTNMNMNEVIASRANEMLTGQRGGKSPVHPNDHVNLGQSSNDVIPTTIHVAALDSIRNRLVPALARLQAALNEKADAFADVGKLGRTHLQDAVPMTLGQEFSGYARQVALGLERLEAVGPRLWELALGGTAVGTGINTHGDFASRTIALMARRTGIPLVEAVNHFSAQAAQDAVVETSGALKTIAVSLVKIANDIRWLASGPRSGLGEITLPSLQPGSSIMPGKVNPVIPEVVLQVAAQVVGNDAVVTVAGQSGSFELNVMLPVMAHNLLQSISLLASAAGVFADRCIAGVTANPKTCSGFIEKSLAMATGLVPRLGYDGAAALSKKALDTGKTVREVALEDGVLNAATLDELLGPPTDR